MITAANLFLIGFALDAAVSVLDELARSHAKWGVFLGVRGWLAQAVVVAAIGNFCLLALDPRLPKRILLPPIAFLVWYALGGYPIALQFDSARASGLALAASQLALALGTLGWIRVRSSTGCWLLDANDLPWVRPRVGYTLRFAIATALIAPTVLAGLAGLSLFGQIERATGGFMTFDHSGIHSISREYQRGDRRIDLVGMAHIGEDDAYVELFESFAGESTLLLEEGVSDEDGLIGEGLFYEDIAGRIGLDVQPSFEALSKRARAQNAELPWPAIRNADVDARVFSADTIAVLEAAARFYDSDRFMPGLAEFQSRLAELGPQATENAFRDLIDRRNEHLLDEIRAGLDNYERIVVPWGALHLPGIEGAILEWGFERTGSSRRRISAYQTILLALLSRDEEP